MKNIKKFGLGFVIAIFVLFSGFASKAHAAAINAATKVDVTPGTQFTTYQGVPVYRLRVSNTGNALDTITTLSPTPSGSANDTLVTLHFFNDANDNGFVDQGDTDLGASAAFASDNTIQTFDIADVPVGVGATASILITAQGNSVANNTFGFNLSFEAASAIAMSVTPSGTFPMLNVGTMTMTTTVPTVIAVDASNNPAPKTVAPGATNVSVKRLAISAVAGTSDSIVSIAPTPTGTANDNLDLTSVKFYIDSGSVPGEVDGTDILLSTTPAVYTGNDARTIFTFLSPVQVAASSTVNILVVYNLGGGIAPASTLYLQVAAVGDVIAGSGTALGSDSSTTSSLITISSSAPNIAIASSKVNSASTVLVTFVNPVENLASVDYTKWHIDVGDGGLTPLNPTSAAITSAGTPWTITLTFSGTPFSNTATAYAAAVGLYADGSAVTDTNSDTNIVVGHAASTVITDGQSPTIVSIGMSDSALKIGDTSTLTIVFSEPVTAFTNADLTIIEGGTLTAVGSGDGGTTWTATFTPTTLLEDPTNKIRVDATGLTDIAGNPGVGTMDTANYAIDTIAPTLTSIILADTALKIGETSLVTFTFSESVAGTFSNADITTIANGTLSAVVNGGAGTVWTATFTPTASIEDATNIITVTMTGITDLAGNPGVGTTSSANYQIDTLITTPAANPVAGSYNGTQNITLSSVGSTSIRFTTDGTAPSCSVGVVYSSAISISASGTIKAIACDNAGNELSNSFVYVISGNSVSGNNPPSVFDTTPPANAYIDISAGSVFTPSVNVVLALTALGANYMMISNNPDFTGASWETYATTKNWSLTSGDGVKNVYVKFKDTAGNISTVVSDMITLVVGFNPAVHVEGCDPGSGNLFTGKSCTIPATPASEEVKCPKGHLFNVENGKRCTVEITTTTTTTPATTTVTTTTTYNFGTALLKNGSKGEPVKELQRFLNKILNLGLVVDGQLGPKTIAVVKKWQKDNSLVSDGLIGAKTKAKMNLMVQ